MLECKNHNFKILEFINIIVKNPFFEVKYILVRNAFSKELC